MTTSEEIRSRLRDKYGITSPSFTDGITSSFIPFIAPVYHGSAIGDRSADAQALQSDWQSMGDDWHMVGDDLRTVMAGELEEINEEAQSGRR